VSRVDTTVNTADLMTKALGAVRHRALMDMCGLMTMDEYNNMDLIRTVAPDEDKAHELYVQGADRGLYDDE
jgi:hypothetical protein